MARIFELRTAIRDFLLNQGRAELAASFSDKVWVTKKDRDAYQAASALGLMRLQKTLIALAPWSNVHFSSAESVLFV